MGDDVTLGELKAREEELEREWLWLVEALNIVARIRAEQGGAAAFRLIVEPFQRLIPPK
jgi:hypothetical protein